MKRLSAYLSTFFRAIKLRGFFYTLKLIWYELAFDRKYKTHTKTVEHLDGKTLAAEANPAFYYYQGASYFVLREVLNLIPAEFRNRGFIDFGCGKGKAMICAAESGFKNVKGIELAKEILDRGEENIQIVKPLFPETRFQLIHASADAGTIAPEDQIFYFFNPFGEEVFEKILKNILQSYVAAPRKLIFVYLNPKFKSVFEKDGFSILKTLKAKNYTEAIIYQYG